MPALSKDNYRLIFQQLFHEFCMNTLDEFGLCYTILVPELPTKNHVELNIDCLKEVEKKFLLTFIISSVLYKNSL